jgi:phosphopantetheine adenylyltransferase/uncharacterized protein (UPF0218 family)
MYNHVVLGGTFDHLHAGHEDLLTLAFRSGKKVTVGLTKPSMNRSKKYSSSIQPYRLREKAIFAYAKRLGREKDLCIIAIKDIFGSTLSDQTLEAIIVTPHTEEGASRINQERKSLGLPQLDVHICPLHHDERGEVLCSTNIRAGLCNQQGFRFDRLLSFNAKLSEHAKEILHRPFGQKVSIAALHKKKTPIVLVGDVVTNFCVAHGVVFTLAYIDGKSKRQLFSPSMDTKHRTVESGLLNPSGEIRKEISEHILLHQGIDSGSIYKIEGEEDLLTVAAVLLLPLNSSVVYGYPFSPESMRCIRITQRIKQIFANLVY